MNNIITIFVFIVTPLLGIVSLFIPSYALLKIRDKRFLTKNVVRLTYTFLILTFIMCLVIYITFEDYSALTDVGDVFQRLSLLLWFIVSILSLMYANKNKIKIDSVKFLSVFSLSMVFAQYVISYFMITKSGEYHIQRPTILVILFSLISLLVIYFEWNKKESI